MENAFEPFDDRIPLSYPKWHHIYREKAILSIDHAVDKDFVQKPSCVHLNDKNFTKSSDYLDELIAKPTSTFSGFQKRSPLVHKHGIVSLFYIFLSHLKKEMKISSILEIQISFCLFKQLRSKAHLFMTFDTHSSNTSCTKWMVYKS